MKRYIGLILLLAAFLSFACNTISTIVERIDPDAQDGGQAADTAVPPTSGQSGAPAVTGDDVFEGLTSYRIEAVITEQETGLTTELTTEGVTAPFALHTIHESGDGRMEMIAMEDAMWLYMPGMGWYKTAMTAEDMALTPDELLAELEDMELPDTPPWPADIIFLPGQAPMPLVEGGLTPAGTDTVNGVACRKYTVQTNYSYEMDMPMLGGVATTAVVATGSICVADQSGLPAIIMQADLYETETTVIGGHETVTTTRIEQEITAINTPITIRPPADAVELDDFMAGLDDDPPIDGSPSIVDLSELSSYRLEQRVTSISDGFEMSVTYLFEWVKEPSAYRLVMDMEGFTIEHLWLEDGVWLRTGGVWTPITADEAPDPFAEISGFMDWDDDMTLVGAETANGVRCQRYMVELSMPQMNGRHDVWVADQADLPPLIIRAVMRMEHSEMTTITESNLYDINQPIAFGNHSLPPDD